MAEFGRNSAPTIHLKQARAEYRLFFQTEAGFEVFASAYRRVLSPAGRVTMGLLLLNFCGCGRYAGEDSIKP